MLNNLKGLLLSENRDYVCKLKKTFYGLKQAPRTWFWRLDKYLKQQGYKRGAADNNLYLKFENINMIIVVVYIDDIIWKWSTGSQCKVCFRNEKGVWNVNARRSDILPWLKGLSKRKRDLHLSNQIYQRHV